MEKARAKRHVLRKAIYMGYGIDPQMSKLSLIRALLSLITHRIVPVTSELVLQW